MNKKELTALILKKKSFLCIGLDTDIDKVPAFLKETYDDPVFEFNRMIIDATIDFAVAYKPNLAFYECNGKKGWESLEKTINYLSGHQGGPVFTIADAKRADIGNSSMYYARTFLENLNFDAVTVNPYMGKDSVEPFLQFPGKWAVILALTSNSGAHDFQVLQPQLPLLLEKFGIKTCYWKKFYEVVMEESMKWGSTDNIMYVVGATQADMLGSVRELVPEHFFLIPGVGVQGGSLEAIAAKAMNKDVGILVNSSRGIIFASEGEDFEDKARLAALALKKKMERILQGRSMI